ncbi:MAG: hypothetical protein WC422_04165 [Candidatus Paceibacterota bacterium]
MERVKNRNTGPIFMVLSVVAIIIFFVFMSLRSSFNLRANETDIGKIIDKDTKELENVSKNLDQNIDTIFGREDFQQLYRHIDINMEFEVGKIDPFKSF